MDAPPDSAVERLEAWRAQAARAARVPEQAIIDDRTLHAIADVGPASPDELVDVPGLGPVKAARFGDALLAALRPPDHRRATRIDGVSTEHPERSVGGPSRRARSSSTRSWLMLMKMPSASAVSTSPA